MKLHLEQKFWINHKKQSVLVFLQFLPKGRDFPLGLLKSFFAFQQNIMIAVNLKSHGCFIR